MPAFISSNISYIYPTVAGGANTTFIMVMVIVVVSVMATVSVFLALKYNLNQVKSHQVLKMLGIF